MLGTVPRVKHWCPETYVPQRESLIKNKEAGKGGEKFSGESVLGGLEVGLSSLGAPPAALSEGTPNSCPALSFLRPTGPWMWASAHSSFKGLFPGAH